MTYYDLNEARFVPIVTWPGVRTQDRKRSPFKATWATTLRLLRRELGYLNAKRITIQIEMDEAYIRQDGFPKANAIARGPGVIVTFESRYGVLSYPCDRFRDWQTNIRAIALGLEALRKVDRYGVTQRGEQYTGWKRLGSGAPAQPAMSVTDAAAFISRWASSPGHVLTASGMTVSADAFRAAFLAAAKKLHPDTGGTVDGFQRLLEAKRVLDLHHGKA